MELFGVPAERFRERYRIGYVPQRQTSGARAVDRPRGGDLGGCRGWAARPPVRCRPPGRRRGHRHGRPGAGRSYAHQPALGGLVRRALIARALAAGPEVLVMDEPTAGVDDESQAALAATLAAARPPRELTMLVVTHDVEPLAGVVTGAVARRRPAPDRNLGGIDGLVANTHPRLDGDAHHDHPDEPRAWTRPARDPRRGAQRRPTFSGSHEFMQRRSPRPCWSASCAGRRHVPGAAPPVADRRRHRARSRSPASASAC